jgi:hypothetical protein
MVENLDLVTCACTQTTLDVLKTTRPLPCNTVYTMSMTNPNATPPLGDWRTETASVAKAHAPNSPQDQLLQLCTKWLPLLLPDHYTNPQLVSASIRYADNEVGDHIELPCAGPALLVIPELKADEAYEVHLGTPGPSTHPFKNKTLVHTGMMYILDQAARWVISHREKWPANLTAVRRVVTIGFTADGIDNAPDNGRPPFAKTTRVLKRRFPKLVNLP